MLVTSVLLFFYGSLIPARAQTVKRSHAITANRQLQAASPGDSLDIVAVRVEFQPDDNRLTSGNGTFGAESIPYLERNEISIDPLPHNRDYFRSHLAFASNYFRKVSGGRMEIEFSILPDVIRLDHPMAFYSPTGTDFTLEKIAVLARDAWRKVEEAGGFESDTLDPNNTAFAIFHAGVGRDIELIGTTLDKTPQDIPSLYMDKTALAENLDDPGFDGFPVNNGTFRITNSMILPRTLSRRGEGLGGAEFVLQLSTNGLICASIGSHLGLPDLFDTDTGESGIGRFGLMDGAAFFSYHGLFPPEPSAWEKQFLGWSTPFDIDLDNTNPVSLPAASLHQPNSMARHAIGLREYFLVENRHRDPAGDGITLTIRKPDGSTEQQRFTNNDETFVFQSEGFADLLTPGVLVDVDNFDWSMPGGLDRGPDGQKGTGDDRFLNGGILIWHIDESVIERNLSNQTVNTRPERRGVDLEEADGAQDIGQPGNEFTVTRSNGSPFDYWWNGNNASVITARGDTVTLYQNRFGADTRPDNRSNSGASTFFELFDFSGNQPTAHFRARRITSFSISEMDLPVDTLPERTIFSPGSDAYLSHYPLALSVYTAASDTFLIVPGRSSTYAVSVNGSGNPLFDFQVAAPQQPYTNNSLVLATKPGALPGRIELESWDWDGTAWTNNWSATGTPNKGFISSVDNQILLSDFTTDRFRISDGTPVADLPVAEQRSLPANGRYASLTPNTLSVTQSSFSEQVNTGTDRIYAGSVLLSAGRSAFYLLEENRFSIVEPGSTTPKRELFASTGLNWPAMTDFDGDGRLDFVYLDRQANRLRAVNINGASVPHFPMAPPEGVRFGGTPLVADIEGDGRPELMVTGRDSISINLYGYQRSGEPVPGFPLFIGSSVPGDNRAVNPVLFGRYLFAVGHRGELKGWHFADMDSASWRSKYGNNRLNKVAGRVGGTGGPAPVQSVLVKSETYNWPNPASDRTHIRYQTSGPGKVTIKIIDASGTVIFEKNYSARGGPPEEQLISTENWGSGIYFGMVKATVNGVSSEKLIKIAVVH